MIGGLVEIANDGQSLRKERGFLVVSTNGEESGRVPLGDITSLILSTHRVTLTGSLISALIDQGITIVHCGANYHPNGLTLPIAGHYEHAGILADQINATLPLKKRLWQAIVREKIACQQQALGNIFPTHRKLIDLHNLMGRVRSGDPENLEAQAARIYWPALMGDDFRRLRDGAGPNPLLNYGYAVLRAATARAVAGAGLHPALGLHHSAKGNPFQLVDDLVEPFRPFVDLVALSCWDEAGRPKSHEVSTENKRALAALLQLDLLTAKGASPLVNCLGTLARSLAASLKEKKPCLVFPMRPTEGELPL